MRRSLLSLLALLVVVGVVAPTVARADTDISLVLSNGWGPQPVYADWDRHEYGGRHRGWHHGGHHGWHHGGHHGWHPRPAVWAPVVVAPRPRTVVYETTVVRPAPYVQDSYMLAEPASPSYVDVRGRTCREYTSSGRVTGSRGVVYGTACLQPDGAWRVVD